MRSIITTFGLAMLLAACGGGADEQPPVQAPPPPTQPPPAPVDTAPPPTADTPPPAPKPAMADLVKSALTNLASSFGDATKMSPLYAPDAVTWMPGVPEIKGHDAVVADYQGLFDALSNEKLAITRAWVKGNMVAYEYVVTGTQSKPLMGIPASEKPFGVNGAAVIWLNDDGLITKEHAYWDVDTYAMQVTGKGKTRPVAEAPSGAVEWHWAKGDATEDKNVAAINKQNADFSKGDIAAAMGVVADDAVIVDYSSPKASSDKKMLKVFATAFFKAFPDAKSTGNNVVGVEDFTLDEYENTGTQKADFTVPGFTLKNTKKPVDLHGIDVIQWKDGKTVKTWTYSNSMEWDAELGVTPEYAKPSTAKADASKAPKKDAKDAGKAPADVSKAPKH